MESYSPPPIRVHITYVKNNEDGRHHYILI